jgi:hypothetical protein
VFLHFLAVFLLVDIEPLLLVIYIHMAKGVDPLLDDFLEVFLELSIVALHFLESLFVDVLEVFTEVVDDEPGGQL